MTDFFLPFTYEKATVFNRWAPTNFLATIYLNITLDDTYLCIFSLNFLFFSPIESFVLFGLL